MLAADNLLKSLNKNEESDYKNENVDYDLGEVLSCFNDKQTAHKLRYSDKKEEYFSFKN